VIGETREEGVLTDARSASPETCLDATVIVINLIQ